MNPAETKAATETKSCSMKAVIAIILIAAIAGCAYYLLSGRYYASNINSPEQLPALSTSDDVTSIKADLESTAVTDEDLSSFDAELSAQ
jgi:hypothetical protein